MIHKVKHFVQETATESHFAQSLEAMKDQGIPIKKDGKSIQPYLHWIHCDIMREFEYLLVRENLDYHGDSIKQEVAKAAMSFYIKQL